jgi:Amt family ammonium transporter
LAPFWPHEFDPPDYDDSLDVVGVHFVGGIVGVLLIGLLATEVMTSGPQGFFYATDSGSQQAPG